MKSKEVEVIKVLLENKDKELSINQVSNILKKDYKTVYNIVKRLVKLLIISVQPFGKAHKLTLTNSLHPLIFEAEYERRRNLFKNKNFLILHNRLTTLKFPFITLLFGSHVKGTQTKHSDIDILAIGGNERDIQAEINLLPDKIHLTHVTYENFIYMLKIKEFTVVSEAIKKNIILIGIEEYYRLIKNAE